MTPFKRLVTVMSWRRGEVGSEGAWKRADKILSDLGIFTSVDSSIAWWMSVPVERADEARAALEQDAEIRPFVIDPRTGGTLGGPKPFAVESYSEPPKEPVDIVMKWHQSIGRPELFAIVEKTLKPAGVRLYFDNFLYENWVMVPKEQAGTARRALLADPDTAPFVSEAR